MAASGLQPSSGGLERAAPIPPLPQVREKEHEQRKEMGHWRQSSGPYGAHPGCVMEGKQVCLHGSGWLHSKGKGVGEERPFHLQAHLRDSGQHRCAAAELGSRAGPGCRAQHNRARESGVRRAMGRRERGRGWNGEKPRACGGKVLSFVLFWGRFVLFS